MTDEQFSEALTEILIGLLRNQVPLDPEFDRVWLENADDLYEN